MREWNSRVAHHFPFPANQINALRGGFVNLLGRFYSFRSRFIQFHRRNRPFGKVQSVCRDGVSGDFGKRLVPADSHDLMRGASGFRESAAGRLAKPMW